jgi:hypothetical protein
MTVLENTSPVFASRCSIIASPFQGFVFLFFSAEPDAYKEFALIMFTSSSSFSPFLGYLTVKRIFLVRLNHIHML